MDESPRSTDTPLETLRQREPIFHQPQFGTTRADFEAMTEPEFQEVGASGRRYSREYVLNTLEARDGDGAQPGWTTTDFECLKIAGDNYLLTYTLDEGDRTTRRATIWRFRNGDWRILYHQGTIVDES